LLPPKNYKIHLLHSLHFRSIYPIHSSPKPFVSLSSFSISLLFLHPFIIFLHLRIHATPVLLSWLICFSGYFLFYFNFVFITIYSVVFVFCVYHCR
jgi:hypothetical protein